MPPSSSCSRLLTIILPTTALLLAVLLACPAAASAAAPGSPEDRSVAEEILNILHNSGQIDDATFERLLVKARGEAAGAKAQASAPAPAAAQGQSLPQAQAPDTTPVPAAAQAPAVQPAAAQAYDAPASAAAPPAQSAQPVVSADSFRVYWKDRLRFETADKRFKMHLGGRVQYDWAAVSASNELNEALNAEGFGTRFRRLYLETGGTLYDDMEFLVQLDFAGSKVSIVDTWLAMNNLPWVGSLRLGHIKEPFLLENITSTASTTFMEHGLQQSFTAGYNLGLMLTNAPLAQRMTWSAGFFQDDTNASGNDFDDVDDFNFSGRVTGLPWWEDDGARLAHLGASYAHRFRTADSADAALSFSSRPETSLVPSTFVDTGALNSSGADLEGLEAALVHGPFSLQGEYVRALVALDGGSDADFQGGYVFGSWILTGEHRPYDMRNGVFGGVRPARNFSLGKDGWGAWELAARWSFLDLDDEGVDGGTLADMTFGVNWYLNPNFKVMLNYVRALLDDRTVAGRSLHDESANIWQGRFQLAF